MCGTYLSRVKKRFLKAVAGKYSDGQENGCVTSLVVEVHVARAERKGSEVAMMASERGKWG